MIKMTRNPWFLLFLGSLWVGSSAEADTTTLVTINFVSDDGVTIKNSSFKYREERAATGLHSGQFSFLNNAYLHALNYTYKSGTTTTVEGCAGATCNVKYDIFTNYMSTPRRFFMDVEWNSGTNHFVDTIDINTLVDLDPDHLPVCDAFKAMDGTIATGTFTRKLNGVTGSAIPISVTTTSCLVTMSETVVICPQPVPVVYCPVYVPPARQGCCLTGLFARHRFRLCHR
jgi:hypothetical protein